MDIASLVTGIVLTLAVISVAGAAVLIRDEFNARRKSKG